MRRPTATQRPLRDVLGRPEGGSGETRPCVSPGGAEQAKREVMATLHQLIDTLTELEHDGTYLPMSDASGDLPLLLDPGEAAKTLSLSRAKVSDMATRGEIPSIRIGRAMRIPRDALLRWIDECTASASNTPRVRLPNWAHVDRSTEL